MRDLLSEKIIGIDLDRTLFGCKSFIYNYFAGVDYHKDKGSKFYEVPQDGIYKCSFINKIFKYINPLKYYAFPEAIETINSLHDNGYLIYFVSSRPNIKPVVSMTYEWLRKNGVKYDKLILGCNNKARYAYENGIKYFIDDLRKNCEKMADNGVKPLLFEGYLKESDRKKLKPALEFEKFESWGCIKNFFDSISDCKFDIPTDMKEEDVLEHSLILGLEKQMSE